MPSSDDGHELHTLDEQKRGSLELEEEREEEMMPTEPAGHDDEDIEREALIGSRQSKHQTNRDKVDTKLDRRTVRKLDTILLPFLALLFLLNSLDKSNIGNAETAGFTYDTGLSRGDVNISMSFFFFVFVVLQPVGAALGRRFGMKRYVPVCMSLWGLCTLLHILVRKRWHLIVLRIAIAALESGFYPTTVSYLSLFYTKYEFGLRLGFFYGMTAIAGVLGGILSWAVFSHFPGDDEGRENPVPPSLRARDVQGWKSWEILFLIEGCLTMAIAITGFFWLPRSADTAWFFKPEERTWAEQRMQADISTTNETRQDGTNNIFANPNDTVPEDHAASSDHDRLLVGNDVDSLTHRASRSGKGRSVTEDSGLSRQDVLSAIFNHKIWHLLVVNILSAIPATAFGVLLPILVKELSPSLNLSAAASNLLSAPPFALGAVVLFAFTIWSDRSKQRLVPILGGLLLLIIGLIMTLVSPMENYWLRYFSLCVLLSGSFIASPLTVAWIANNTPEPGKRAIMLGINGWGNLAGVFMSVLFTPKGEKTGYVGSFTVLLVCALISFSGFIAFYVLLLRENLFRDNVTRSWSEEEKRREDLLGDVSTPVTTAQSVAERLGVLRLARRLGLDDTRKGDEKLTYRYTL